MMSHLTTLLPAVAGFVCLALAAAALLPRPLNRLQWSFALGMLALGVQSVAAWVLLDGATDLPAWLRLHAAAGLVAALPWGLFVVALTHHQAPIPGGWRAALAAASGLVVVGAIGLTTGEILRLPPRGAPFEIAGVAPAGLYVAILEILLSVAILAGLEAALRGASVRARWSIKFLALGLGGVFLVRFYLASQVVAFRVITAESLMIQAATLLVATLVLAVGVARERLGDVELTISRAFLYRSAVVTVLGLYLLAVGVLGWVLNYLEIPEKAFWGSLVVFVSALALALVLLSDRVRWRIRRFVELNLYRSKYDYREHWVAFTTRMGSLVTVDEIGPRLLETLTEAVGSTRATLYLADTPAGRYRTVAIAGLSVPPSSVEPDAPLVARLQTGRAPIVLDGGAESASLAGTAGSFGEGSVAVPLVWRGALTGFILLGPERTGLGYGPEDLLFMATLGEQAAGSIATARMSEALAQSREFEAFTRLTSYVIHDVKNSVSALSLLARNALTHFDDPEFQRDSIRTLSRTVERMTRLLGKLGAPEQAIHLAVEPVDLAPIVDEAVRPLRAEGRLHVVTEIHPAPAVAADPEALLRALQNLVKNAAEAITGAGTVTIRVEDADGAVTVSVTDTGPGMSEEFVRTSLFAPFRSTKDGGWGIGLVQARDIVERHGGSLAVTSALGVGTTFRVRLPVAAEALAALSGSSRETRT